MTVEAQTAKRAQCEPPRGLGDMTWSLSTGKSATGAVLIIAVRSPATPDCALANKSGNSRLQSCVTKHGNPRLRAAGGVSLEMLGFHPMIGPVQMERSLEKSGAHDRAEVKKAIVAWPTIGSGSVASTHRPADPRAIGIKKFKQGTEQKSKRRFEGNSCSFLTWSVRGAPEILTCPVQVHATGAGRRIRLGAASTLPLPATDRIDRMVTRKR